MKCWVVVGSWALAGLSQRAHAQLYKIGTRDEVLQSARTLAYDLMLFYQGNKTGQIPGILPGPPTENKGDYYWWEGGAMMGTYIDYWHLTGDPSYNDVVTQGMLHQVGEHWDYMPANHTASMGNDDQGFWGMSAMLAAETGFPNPPPDQAQWLALAQAVFNTQAHPDRHDTTCGGGLRWQVPPTNMGYNYKNTIANACFFNLGARLARYTANETYIHWAEKTFQWLWDVHYIDHTTYSVYDGGHVEHNCTDINKAQFSYNAALLAHGAAFLYNATSSPGAGVAYNITTTPELWRNRTNALVTTLLATFFPQQIAFEIACESRKGACTADMLSFKGYVHRWLGVVAQLAPFTRDAILPVLRSSAAAAVRQCTGGASGRQCGFYWEGGTYIDVAVDQTSGAGEAMDVLAAVSSLMVEWEGARTAPLTNSTGGNSTGDPDAGSRSTDTGLDLVAITMGDRLGAGFLTTFLLFLGMATIGWMSTSYGDSHSIGEKSTMSPVLPQATVPGPVYPSD